MTTFEIAQPLKWHDFYSNLPMLASTRFLKKWKGNDDPSYEEFTANLPSDYFIPYPGEGATDAIFFGDINAAMAVALATNLETGTTNLLILKWLGAQLNYRVPSRLKILAEDRKVQNQQQTKLLVEDTDYFLGEGTSPGSEIISGKFHAAVKLSPGTHMCVYREIEVDENLKATFGIYVLPPAKQLVEGSSLIS